MARPVVSVTWRLDPTLFGQLQQAARRKGVSVQAYASDALRRAVDEEPKPEKEENHNLEADARWLDGDLSRLGEFEPYDWGPDGVPEVTPIAFDAGVGFTVADRT